MKIVIASVCAVAVFTGCSNNEYSGNSYDSRNIGEVSRTSQGVVISRRSVELKPEDTTAGTALGAVGGGIVGSMFGGGHAKIMTAAAGAVAGGVAGNQLASRGKKGVEYMVKLTTGEVVSITQAEDPPIATGQQVMIVYSARGRSRVVPA